MRIELMAHGTAAVASVAGEVDLASGSRFVDEVLSKLPDGTNALVIDLADLKYMDSAGVHSIFEIAAVLANRDHFLAIAVPEESPLRSIFKMTQVEEVATICATREEALDLALNPG